MPKQLNLLGQSTNKVNLQILLNNNYFYFWLGQLIFFVVYTVFLWMVTSPKYFDILIFPGLMQIGLSSVSIGMFVLIFVRLGIFLIFNFSLLFFAYRFGKITGSWFLQNILKFIILINFVMLLYW